MMDDEKELSDQCEHSQASGDYSENVQEDKVPHRLTSNISKLVEGSSRRDGKESLTHDSAHENTMVSTACVQDSLSSKEPVKQRVMRKDSHVGNEDHGPKTAGNYSGFPSGFQLRNSYEHNKKLTDLVDVTYNPRTRQFIFLDTRGITTWDKEGIEHSVNRSLCYPKYVNNLLKKIIYARKYNVYFCLAKDFSLKVLNKDFYETCNVASDLSSVMFLIFNPVRDELITGGVKGTKVWEFKQVTDQVWKEIKPMANYGLFLKRELSGIKGGWIRKVELEQQLQYLYCCSDTDVLCYNMEGKAIFTLTNAHKSQINGCKFSPQARVLITCSSDSEVKVWSMTGGHVHTFRGHSRSVTGMVLHPEVSSLVLTCSMDGTVRMWSLDIMELMYTIVISTDGIAWMGLTGEKFLWTATHRDLSVWHLNHVLHFYALARCRVTALYVAGCEGKTTRLVAVGDDSSVRLISMKDQKSLSTVLPPPSISPLQHVQAVTYNRQFSTVYLLINPTEIWVYTMRTDPACRTAVWDVERLQDKANRGQSAASRADSGTAKSRRPLPRSRGLSTVQLGHTFPKHRATLQGRGSQTPSLCTSITTLTSPVLYWTEEGFVCPVNCNFLVMGLMDGRVLFMDPMEYGRRYCEFQASKDAILEMVFDSSYSTLITKSHLREEDIFQFWSLPSLELHHLLLVPRDVTGFARLLSVFLTGHCDGTLMLHHLKPATSSTIYSSTDPGDAVRERRRDHLAPIVSVDSCPSLDIFVSCSCDGAVKVWDADKLLMTEISLEKPISSALFINTKGDLMLGYMNHLFLIEHGKILPSTSKVQFPDDSLETESEIYEDPAVRYEGAAANPDPLDMRSYLVPYNLDFSERFREGRTSPASSPASSDKSDSGDEASEFSKAATEVYQSPSMTPRRLSVVDMLTSRQDASKDEINRRMLSLFLTRKRRSRSSRLSFNQEDQHQLEFDMPQFGTSPGPSPTPSPPSSRSEFDISEDESEKDISDGGSEEEEEEKTYDGGSMMIVKTSVADFEQLMKKESREVQVTDLRPPLEEVSRFSLSKMKIDAKSLLRQRVSGATAPKTGKSDKTSQPHKSSVAEIKTSQQKLQKLKGHRTRPVIKKKTKKGIQLRVGERAAAASRVRLEAASAVPSTTSTTAVPATPATPKPSEPDVTIPAKLTVSLESGVTDTKQTSQSPSGSSTTMPTPQPSESSPKFKPPVEVPALPKVPSLPRTPTEDQGVSGKPAAEESKQRLTKTERKSIFDDWKKPDRTKISLGETNLEASDKDGQRAMPSASSVSTPAIRGPDGGAETSDHQNQYPDSWSQSIASGRLDSHVKSRSSVKSAIAFQDKELQTSGILANKQMEKHVGGDGDDETLPDQMPTVTSEEPSASLLRKIIKSPVALPPRPGKGPGGELVGQGMEQTRVEVFIPTGSVDEQGFVREETEGRLARPNTAEGRLITQRPHTARGGLHVNFEDELLLDGLDTTIPRHFSCPGSPVDINSIYRNDGLHFEDKWQEKLIVRHQILKWQQEQRIQVAADRRRLLELRKQQRRSALLGHHHCALADDQTHDNFHHQEVCVTHSDTSLNKRQRCKSAPSRRRVVPSSPPIQPQQAFESKTKEQDLTAERPYRFRISRDSAPNIKPRLPAEDVFEEPGPDDSSHTRSRLIKRPYSTKSIPSKTRRYILITKIQEEANIPVPTILERHLLAERFPQTRLHRLRQLRQLQEPQRRVFTPNLDFINVSNIDDESYCP